MCLNQVTIDWKGRFYDCDFNLAIDLPENGWSNLDTVLEFIKRSKNKDSNSSANIIIKKVLIGKKIFIGEHCFTCTAGSGSSCHGALQK
jgi:hypothetical protein